VAAGASPGPAAGAATPSSSSTPRLASLRASEVRVGPGMDEPAVRAALEPAVRQALGCYEEALHIRPTLRAALAARLTLDARGCITPA